MKKLIGVTAGYKPHSTSRQKLELHRAYIACLCGQGAVPAALPPIPGMGSIRAIVNVFDGFVLSGGGDIDPSLGGPPCPETAGNIDRERDVFEIMLAREALRRRRPVLGICKGAQVLNVACGGTLIGDIRTEHPSRIAHDKSTHTVALERTSRLGRIFQQRVLTVNSTHHQAVKEPGKGLRAVAHAPDGIIEAVEAVDTAVFAVGVQFHPERMCAKNPLIAALFRRFVENC